MNKLNDIIKDLNETYILFRNVGCLEDGKKIAKAIALLKEIEA